MATLESTTESTTTGSSTISVTLDNADTTNDIVVISVAQTQGGAVPNHTTPSGWTLLQVCDGEFLGIQNVWWRQGTGSLGASVSVTSDDNGRAVAHAFRISGASGIDVSGKNNQAFDSSHDSPSITTSADNELVIVTMAQFSAANPFNPTVPSGSTLAADTNNSSTALASAYFTQVSAGATGVQTWGNGDADLSTSVIFAVTDSAGSSSILPLINAYYS